MNTALGAIAAAAFLVGCATGLPSTVSAPRILSQTTSSWIDAAAATGALLYVSDGYSDHVEIYSYPKGTLVGTLIGFKDPSGECVDAGGNVFVTDTYASEVIEYAHGGTIPIATRKDRGFLPVGCSVDPVSGNLAVTNFASVSYGDGNLVLYNAQGKIIGKYADQTVRGMSLCGYDPSGNLFADGLSLGSTFAFVELPHGARALVDLTLDRTIGQAGGVQWDGYHVAVGDSSTNTIYRFKIVGKRGTLAGTTQLGDASEVSQFFIDGRKVIGPDSRLADIGFWSYPAGGPPLKTIDGLTDPTGAVVTEP